MTVKFIRNHVLSSGPEPELESKSELKPELDPTPSLRPDPELELAAESQSIDD